MKCKDAANSQPSTRNQRITGTIAYSSKYGQQEFLGIFLQLHDQVLSPNLDLYCLFFCDLTPNMDVKDFFSI
jgi:hypothetical protein